jgi:arylsulfatase A-like enzyme
MATCCAVAAAACGFLPTRTEPPSILLIVVDTLRADRTDASRGAQLMPVAAALGTRAWLFEHAISGAPLTMPSVAALMTGLYPDRAGVVSHDRRTRLECTSPTLAELAHQAGYHTAAIVANPWLANAATGFDRGFGVYRTRRTEKLGAGRLDARQVTDLALDTLASARVPLFLWAHYIDAHMPYQPPQADAAAAGNPAGSSAIVRDFVAGAVDRETIYFQPGYAAAEIDATRRLYDGAARYVDREIARLLAAFEHRFGDDEIVVLTADHGEALGEHGLFFAHDFTLYDELVRVPLIVKLPGERAARFASPVSLVDVLPTLCARARMSCPTDLDGRELGSDDAASPARTPRAFFSVGPPFRARYARNPFVRVPGPAGRWAAVRVGDEKLIRIPEPGSVRWEAYDLRADPAETRNVFNPALHARLGTLLEQWMQAQRSGRARDPSPRSALDRDTIEELRALGYLD